MRDWLLRIHLYGGLLCSSYLLIFGLSSLMFSHPSLFPSESQDRVTWNRDVVVDTTLSDKELSETVRNALDLMGWGLPREVNREEVGVIKLMVQRPGKSYHIRLSDDGKHAEIEEQRRGYWSVISDLHAFGDLPGSFFVSTWRLYTELCTIVVLFAAASGVYFFAIRPRERRSGLILLGGGSGLSLLLILTVWLWG